MPCDSMATRDTPGCLRSRHCTANSGLPFFVVTSSEVLGRHLNVCSALLLYVRTELEKRPIEEETDSDEDFDEDNLNYYEKYQVEAENEQKRRNMEERAGVLDPESMGMVSNKVSFSPAFLVEACSRFPSFSFS